LKCESVPAKLDKFVQLQYSIADDMEKFGLIDHTKLRELWRRLDYNGNNIVSLAEIDKLVVELTEGGAWPAWMNNKPALMRAYKKTMMVDSVQPGSDGVRQTDFHALLLNIFWFNKLFQVFGRIDSDHDRNIDAREFVQGMDNLGLKLSQAEAQVEFKNIDKDGSGSVPFVEFCAYIRNRVSPDHDPHLDSDLTSPDTTTQELRKSHGDAATHTHYACPKSMRQFDDLEDKIKALCKDMKGLRKHWGTLDFNGNGVVSLAEIDKWVVENYPLLNHKPALMRCYKCTIKSGDYHDDFVHRKDFKRLIVNLFYFNKLYWVFSEANSGDDTDRRMDVNEFLTCLTICNVQMSAVEAQREFRKVDLNGGGFVLFDEFCHYFASKSCPQGMTDFTDDGFDRTHGDGTEEVLANAGLLNKKDRKAAIDRYKRNYGKDPFKVAHM